MVEAKTAKKKAPVAKKEVTEKPVKAPKNESSLYAVFATGGKQYRVKEGDKVKIEKLSHSTSSGQADYKEGDKIVFDKVLMVDDGKGEATIGAPFIKGSEIKATLNKIARHKTIDVIKYKQKSRYFKKYGHRQPYFEVLIDSIK